MSSENSASLYTKEAVRSAVTGAILGFAQSQFSGAVGDDTFLGADLGLKSLDFVRFVSALQQQYAHKMLPFQDLFMSADGSFKQDIKVSDLVDFLHAQLND